MARSSIGVDIGTRAVAIAEVQNGSDGPTLNRFGRMLLPVGAVDHGEVLDPQAVARAITALYKRLGLTNKSVHIGVSNRRVVVRVIELPAMSKEDMDGAIRFQAQEHIPIPLAEAVMDYEVLEDIEGPDGERFQRVLVVAAERTAISPLLAATQAANLEVTTLELEAYPLVRCFANGSAGAEAIVDIGAGVTNVVVHQGGKIRFTRILPSFGGDEFTTAIEQALGVTRDEAEQLKRRASKEFGKPRSVRAPRPVAVGVGVPSGRPVAPSARVAPVAPVARVAVAVVEQDSPTIDRQVVTMDTTFDPFGHAHAVETEESFATEAMYQPLSETSYEPAPMVMEPEVVIEPATPVELATDVIEPMLERFVTEVRGSLDFFAGLPDSPTIDKIVLTGGGALMGGIAEQLRSSLGIVVEQGRPFHKVPVGKVGVTDEEKAIAEPFIGVAIGLALAGMGT